MMMELDTDVRAGRIVPTLRDTLPDLASCAVMAAMPLDEEVP